MAKMTPDEVEALSLGWEVESGYDSIPTIERVYARTERGAFRCCFRCKVTRRDAEAMWRHVHTGHGRNDLPPDDFDYGKHL